MSTPINRLKSKTLIAEASATQPGNNRYAMNGPLNAQGGSAHKNILKEMGAIAGASSVMTSLRAKNMGQANTSKFHLQRRSAAMQKQSQYLGPELTNKSEAELSSVAPMNVTSFGGQSTSGGAEVPSLRICSKEHQVV
jgi:hypothetical protein